MRSARAPNERRVCHYGSGPAVEEHRRRCAEILLVRLPRRVMHRVTGFGSAAHTIGAEARLAGQHVVQLLGFVVVAGVVQIRSPHGDADSHAAMLDDRIRTQ